MSYVDLHLHLLPGVDDGARNVKRSIEFSRRLVHEGVGEVTVTPHVGCGMPFDPLSIPDRVASLQASLHREGVRLRLRCGGEIHPTGADALSDAELEVVSHGPPGSRWVLMEVPFSGITAEFVETCGRVRARGYALLIAHPERASGLVPEGLEMLGGEIRAGSLLQVNVCSLLGNHGPAIQRAAVKLVRDGLAFVLASDAHPGTREHTVTLGYQLAVGFGASPLGAWRLTQGNPRVLLDRGIPPAVERGAILSDATLPLDRGGILHRPVQALDQLGRGPFALQMDRRHSLGQGDGGLLTVDGIGRHDDSGHPRTSLAR
jgi:protein-tyrosine phosphatase